MKQFVVYQAETGTILRCGVCPPELLEEQAQTGESVIEGEADMLTDHVVAGLIVPRNAADLEAEDIARATIDLRIERDRRLTATDWTQAPDAPVDRAAWAVYRQALRDLPANTPDPRAPRWPLSPQEQGSQT